LFFLQVSTAWGFCLTGEFVFVQAELFESQLPALNLSDYVKKVVVVNVDIAGIPGISALFPCFAGVPSRTYVRPNSRLHAVEDGNKKNSADVTWAPCGSHVVIHWPYRSLGA
jgi:hypothetical protein